MKKGFTLIELLVVVLIIGILAAVALPQYTKAVEKSRATEAMQILGDLATAESIYYMTNGSYVADATVLDLDFPNASEGTITGKSFNIVLTAPSDGAGFSAVATRTGGAYAGGTLNIGVSNTGAVSRGTGEATANTGFQAIVSQLWKN